MALARSDARSTRWKRKPARAGCLAKGGHPTNLEVDFIQLVKSLTQGGLAEPRSVHGECHPGQRRAIFRIDLDVARQLKEKGQEQGRRWGCVLG